MSTELTKFVVSSCLVLAALPFMAQAEEAEHKQHSAQHEKAAGHTPKGEMMHHAGGHMQHGKVFAESKNFPTISYTETKKIRPIQRPGLPPMQGDPVMGKALAYDGNKGRCLSCHVMGADGTQAGNVGPNLSAYAKSGRTRAYTFQHIMDARAHNPKTVMPPFGTNDILSRHEVNQIVAYLDTLKTHVTPVPKPELQARNFYVAKEDFTRADAYVEQGKFLFVRQAENGKSCGSCHAPEDMTARSLKGVAAGYPKYDSGVKKIVGLEQRINICQIKYIEGAPYRLGTKSSNMLMSYVKYLSRNAPIRVAKDMVTRAATKRGKKSFYQKAGQLNFSCADCHTSVSGKWLRGQPLAEIEANKKSAQTAATWPRHFIAGHDLGLISLRQRIRHCQIVTHTNPLMLHAQEYTDMELYITSLANGKPMLAPTMSKLRGED